MRSRTLRFPRSAWLVVETGRIRQASVFVAEL